MIKFSQKGDFSKIDKFLKNSKRINYRQILEKYAKKGVQALSDATPKDSGNTAASWDYRIVIKDSKYSIEWFNTNNNKGVNIAIILQYGHATKDGSYVEGIDYINPALKPIFDEIAKEAWKEVNK